MPLRRLVFLGLAGGKAPGEIPLLHEGAPFVAGEAAALVRRRSPWREDGEVERVIVGSHPMRADVLISGAGILPEHVRLYLPRNEGKTADLLAIHPGSTRVNGRIVDPREWVQLLGGEELELGPWRFRYEEATG